MVKVKPVDRTVKKQLDRATAGRDDYEYFVQNPRQGPATAAVEKRDDLEAKMKSKDTWDKWETSLKGVGDQGVIDAAVEKGVDRFVPGVEYGSDKYASFYSEFSDHLERNLDTVLDMPKKNLQDSIKRASKMIELNAEFSFSGR